MFGPTNSLWAEVRPSRAPLLDSVSEQNEGTLLSMTCILTHSERSHSYCTWALEGGEEGRGESAAAGQSASFQELTLMWRS